MAQTDQTTQPCGERECSTDIHRNLDGTQRDHEKEESFPKACMLSLHYGLEKETLEMAIKIVVGVHWYSRKKPLR